MLAFFKLLSIFSMVSSNCVELYITGEYWVKGQWVVEASTTIYVDGTNVAIGEFVVSGSDYFPSIGQKVVIGNSKATPCNDPSCPITVESNTYFFEIDFAYYRNGLDNEPVSITSKLLLAVVDAGIISFAKGNIIEHRKTYHGSHTRRLLF